MVSELHINVVCRKFGVRKPHSRFCGPVNRKSECCTIVQTIQVGPVPPFESEAEAKGSRKKLKDIVSTRRAIAATLIIEKI